MMKKMKEENTKHKYKKENTEIENGPSEIEI